MMRITQLLFFGLASCSLAPAVPAGVPSDPHTFGLGLPAARGPLEFPDGTKEVTLAWCLSELGRLTGQELTLSPQLLRQLEARTEPLEITTPVPAEEVYAFVEALLIQENAFLAPLKGGTRPVLGVFGGGGPAGLTGAQAIPVTLESLPELDAHPAVLCKLVMSFENVDSRQLQTQLRQLIVDNTGAQQVVPCGDRGLLIQGPSAKVASLARLLVEVDRASVPRPAPAEGSKPTAGPPGKN